MLSQSGPLGLAHRLLNVEPLPFGSVSAEDRELMQLKTVLEGHPCAWIPPFGHLNIYFSPQVTLVHLAANAILLGLQITGKEVLQLLVHLGNCLFVSLLGFLEHLLGLLNLHLVRLNVNIQQDSVLGPSALYEILQPLELPHNSLSKLPALHFQPLLDDVEDCNDVCKVFLSITRGKDGHVDMGIVRKLDLQDLRFLLGCHDICLSNIRDRWLVAQLPFLALRIPLPIGSLEGSTHFGMLPESGTEHKFLERRLWLNS
jgi:hypothetical protein